MKIKITKTPTSDLLQVQLTNMVDRDQTVYLSPVEAGLIADAVRDFNHMHGECINDLPSFMSAEWEN